MGTISWPNYSILAKNCSINGNFGLILVQNSLHKVLQRQDLLFKQELLLQQELLKPAEDPASDSAEASDPAEA